MVLVIDPSIAGISGDMLLSSLVDLGAKTSKIISGVKEAQKFLVNSKIKKIEFNKVNKHGVNATGLFLQLAENYHDRKGIQIQECIVKTAIQIGLSEKAINFAKDSIETLIQAESKIHGVPKNSVHFHEAASIDTVIDILGTAIALDDLKCFEHEIISMPVAVGNGTITFSHGTVSNPAGAILEIFKKSGIFISGNNAKSELTTPTGAAMLVNLAKSRQYYPLMKIDSVGYGAGQKNFEGFSNVLKLVIGEKSTIQMDSVSILETNVDDVSGEVLGHLIEKLMSGGAKDVSVFPTLTKKGRPGHMIYVICDKKDEDNLAKILISETGTLGVRIRTSDRLIVPRRISSYKIKIQNKNFTVRCKTSGKSFKIEYEDIKKISGRLELTFRETEELIKSEVKRQLK